MLLLLAIGHGANDDAAAARSGLAGAQLRWQIDFDYARDLDAAVRAVVASVNWRGK